MELTRPARARIYAITLTTVWLLAAYVLFHGAGSMSWTSTGSGLGHRQRDFGLVAWLTVTEENVLSSGAAGPRHTRSVDVSWGVLLAVAAGLIMLALLLRLAHRRLTARDRLVDRCDECGYDLKGSAGAQCPECGHAITASRPRA